MHEKRTLSPEVVERLRQSEERAVAQGHEAGTQWAEQKAEASELRALSGYIQSCESPWTTDEPVDELCHVIDPEGTGNGADCRAWLGSRPLSAAFIAGFADGAVDVLELFDGVA